MTSDDPGQVSPSLADISQEKIENIAFKIWKNKSLNADDRQTIYLALTGEWESLSFFRKTRGPKKPKAFKFRGLAEDVKKLSANDQNIKDHMADLGKKHQLHGLEKVSLETFNKNLRVGRESVARFKEFKKCREERRRRRAKAICN